MLNATVAAEVTVVRVEGLLQPQVARRADGTTHIVGVTPDADGSDVIYRRRGEDGVLSPPRTVNDQPRSATCIGTLEGRQPSLVNCMTAVMKSAFAWAHREGHISVVRNNPPQVRNRT